MTQTTSPPLFSAAGRATIGEPAWEIATLFPSQGQWTQEEYFALGGNHLVEFCDGVVEVLPMPTMIHQLIALFLYDSLRVFFAGRRLGMILVSPFKIRVAKSIFREPDVMVMLSANASRMTNEFWDGADLVVEVVSPSDPARDWELKRKEYALGGIPEYWIVDPFKHVVVVLKLDSDHYVVHGEFNPGDTATSVLLPGFQVDVNALFAAAENRT